MPKSTPKSVPLEALLKRICSRSTPLANIPELCRQVIKRKDCTPATLADFIGHPERFSRGRGKRWCKTAHHFFVDGMPKGRKALKELSLDQMLDVAGMLSEDIYSEMSDWWTLIFKNVRQQGSECQLLTLFEQEATSRTRRNDWARQKFVRRLLQHFSIPKEYKEARKLQRYLRKLNLDDSPDVFLRVIMEALAKMLT